MPPATHIHTRVDRSESYISPTNTRSKLIENSSIVNKKSEILVDSSQILPNIDPQRKNSTHSGIINMHLNKARKSIILSNNGDGKSTNRFDIDKGLKVGAMNVPAGKEVGGNNEKMVSKPGDDSWEKNVHNTVDGSFIHNLFKKIKQRNSSTNRKISASSDLSNDEDIGKNHLGSDKPRIKNFYGHNSISSNTDSSNAESFVSSNNNVSKYASTIIHLSNSYSITSESIDYRSEGAEKKSVLKAKSNSSSVNEEQSNKPYISNISRSNSNSRNILNLKVSTLPTLFEEDSLEYSTSEKNTSIVSSNKRLSSHLTKISENNYVKGLAKKNASNIYSSLKKEEGSVSSNSRESKLRRPLKMKNEPRSFMKPSFSGSNSVISSDSIVANNYLRSKLVLRKAKSGDRSSSDISTSSSPIFRSNNWSRQGEKPRDEYSRGNARVEPEATTKNDENSSSDKSSVKEVLLDPQKGVDENIKNNGVQGKEGSSAISIIEKSESEFKVTSSKVIEENLPVLVNQDENLVLYGKESAEVSSKRLGPIDDGLDEKMRSITVGVNDDIGSDQSHNDVKNIYGFSNDQIAEEIVSRNDKKMLENDTIDKMQTPNKLIDGGKMFDPSSNGKNNIDDIDSRTLLTKQLLAKKNRQFSIKKMSQKSEMKVGHEDKDVKKAESKIDEIQLVKGTSSYGGESDVCKKNTYNNDDGLGSIGNIGQKELISNVNKKLGSENDKKFEDVNNDNENNQVPDESKDSIEVESGFVTSKKIHDSSMVKTVSRENGESGETTRNLDTKNGMGIEIGKFKGISRTASLKEKLAGHSPMIIANENQGGEQLLVHKCAIEEYKAILEKWKDNMKMIMPTISSIRSKQQLESSNLIRKGNTDVGTSSDLRKLSGKESENLILPKDEQFEEVKAILADKNAFLVELEPNDRLESGIMEDYLIFGEYTDQKVDMNSGALANGRNFSQYRVKLMQTVMNLLVSTLSIIKTDMENKKTAPLNTGNVRSSVVNLRMTEKSVSNESKANSQNCENENGSRVYEMSMSSQTYSTSYIGSNSEMENVNENIYEMYEFEKRLREVQSETVRSLRMRIAELEQEKSKGSLEEAGESIIEEEETEERKEKLDQDTQMGPYIQVLEMQVEKLKTALVQANNERESEISILEMSHTAKINSLKTNISKLNEKVSILEHELFLEKQKDKYIVSEMDGAPSSPKSIEMDYDSENDLARRTKQSFSENKNERSQNEGSFDKKTLESFTKNPIVREEVVIVKTCENCEENSDMLTKYKQEMLSLKSIINSKTKLASKKEKQINEYMSQLKLFQNEVMYLKRQLGTSSRNVVKDEDRNPENRFTIRGDGKDFADLARRYVATHKSSKFTNDMVQRNCKSILPVRQVSFGKQNAIEGKENSIDKRNKHMHQDSVAEAASGSENKSIDRHADRFKIEKMLMENFRDIENLEPREILQMMTEQKEEIEFLHRSKKETVNEYEGKISSLKSQIDRMGEHIELLAKEKRETGILMSNKESNNISKINSLEKVIERNMKEIQEVRAKLKIISEECNMLVNKNAGLNFVIKSRQEQIGKVMFEMVMTLVAKFQALSEMERKYSASKKVNMIFNNINVCNGKSVNATSRSEFNANSPRSNGIFGLNTAVSNIFNLIISYGTKATNKAKELSGYINNSDQYRIDELKNHDFSSCKSGYEYSYISQTELVKALDSVDDSKMLSLFSKIIGVVVKEYIYDGVSQLIENVRTVHKNLLVGVSTGKLSSNKNIRCLSRRHSISSTGDLCRVNKTKNTSDNQIVLGGDDGELDRKGDSFEMELFKKSLKRAKEELMEVSGQLKEARTVNQMLKIKLGVVEKKLEVKTIDSYTKLVDLISYSVSRDNIFQRDNYDKLMVLIVLCLVRSKDEVVFKSDCNSGANEQRDRKVIDFNVENLLTSFKTVLETSLNNYALKLTNRSDIGSIGGGVMAYQMNESCEDCKKYKEIIEAQKMEDCKERPMPRRLIMPPVAMRRNSAFASMPASAFTAAITTPKLLNSTKSNIKQFTPNISGAFGGNGIGSNSGLSGGNFTSNYYNNISQLETQIKPSIIRSIKLGTPHENSNGRIVGSGGMVSSKSEFQLDKRMINSSKYNESSLSSVDIYKGTSKVYAKSMKNQVSSSSWSKSDSNIYDSSISFTDSSNEIDFVNKNQVSTKGLNTQGFGLFSRENSNFGETGQGIKSQGKMWASDGAGIQYSRAIYSESNKGLSSIMKNVGLNIFYPSSNTIHGQHMKTMAKNFPSAKENWTSQLEIKGREIKEQYLPENIKNSGRIDDEINSQGNLGQARRNLGVDICRLVEDLKSEFSIRFIEKFDEYDSNQIIESNSRRIEIQHPKASEMRVEFLLLLQKIENEHAKDIEELSKKYKKLILNGDAAN
ncbi:hypothetical protein AYI70_g3312 [Smittium culicis]|uniref:Uncharacterized protein n=1 Tax=Smittium culicis TaxID=133412 RepID=A0A1R1Y3Y2_9FUNG|nr:hypothetical protein AYI70_g3312 [Smittium culicis]